MRDEDKPPAWAVALQQTMTVGFDAVEKRLDTMEANLELQGGSVHDLGRRMTLLEERVGKTEDKQHSDSLRARAMSDVDLSHDAAIAQLHEKMDRLIGIGDRLEKVAGNPTVRRVGYAVAMALLGYLTAKGWIAR